MRITLRIIVSIVLVIATIVFFFSLFQAQKEKERLITDLERRASLFGESLKESLEPLIEKAATSRIKQIVQKFSNRGRLAGIAVYDTRDQLIVASSNLTPTLLNPPRLVSQVMNTDQEEGEVSSFQGKEMYLYALPLHREDNVLGALLLLYDASFIADRVHLIWKDNFLRLLIQALFISLTTLLVIRGSMLRPISRMAEWMKHLRVGKELPPPPLPRDGFLEPLAKEVTRMARSISAARQEAEEEARLRHAADSLWTPARLREHIRSLLQDRPLVVISNREPYIHERKGKTIQCIVPASGLVTALEPVLIACGGTWIAHGSGSADREVVDGQDKIRVPPEEPQYTLRRIWLSKEEEKGYYYGFANEGLWPLCHIAHTRPTFREEDWQYYQTVNQKFAAAVGEELAGTNEPMILIQDYHFALLPRLIKKERPDARVAIFWHIPWPNPESFGICPWQKEILQGMLGADLIGFHVQFHCNNFMETVDRALESRLNWEQFSIEHGGHSTSVKSFPISIGIPGSADPSQLEDWGSRKENLFKELGLRGRFLGVGVDRIDYTKGIVERFLAIERFLEKYPSYQGQFTFVELGAPSRTHIKEYQKLLARVEGEAERINWRFQTKDWKPILFLKKHHSHEEIRPFYEAADLCMVTSLHDGMNLVAKEFISHRPDESGVLILSQFTGAARELRDALIVNPYDIEQMAEAIRMALEMDPLEQKHRMGRMRQILRDWNIYRWAGNLISTLSAIRLDEKSWLRVGSEREVNPAGPALPNGPAERIAPPGGAK
jgi:trehalose-6-phosphate synthase/HAMP domain-containing protein